MCQHAPVFISEHCAGDVHHQRTQTHAGASNTAIDSTCVVPPGCVARLDRYGSAFTLLYLDLDKFKAVNDTLGHQAGDQLLIEVAKRLSATVRKADVVARLGGDEFALLLTDESDPGSVGNLASRLIELVCMPYLIDGQELQIGVSIGVAIAPVDGREYAAHNPGMRAHAELDSKKRNRLAMRGDRAAAKMPGKRKVVQNAVRPSGRAAISDRSKVAMAEPGRG